MCLVSSFFCLLASLSLSARHPRERGEPSYSECCCSVLPLHCQCCCRFFSMLLSVVASTFPNATSGACGRMDSCVHGNDSWGAWRVLSFYVRRCCWCFLSSFTLLTFFFSFRSACFFFLSFFSSSSRTRGSIVQRLLFGITASLPVLLSVLLYVVVWGECIFKCDIRRVRMNGFPCARE